MKIPMLGVALLGASLAYIHYQREVAKLEEKTATTNTNNTESEEYENDEGEYEN